MKNRPPATVPQFERMANDLQHFSEQLRLRPKANHLLADKLERLSKQMREDEAGAYPDAVE
jgi:hypothetical protein